MKNLCRRFSGRNNRFFHQEGIDGDFPGRFSETGDAMLNRNLDKLFAASCRLPEPANLYEGVSLPDDFELPDNLLLFFHDFCAAAPNAHHRYTLVFPFAEMRYYVDQLQYDLKPGQMLLLRPYQLRFLSPESAGYQRFFITFTLRKPQPYLPKTTVCELHEACYALLKQMLDFYAKKESIRSGDSAFSSAPGSLGEYHVCREQEDVAGNCGGNPFYFRESAESFQQ